MALNKHIMEAPLPYLSREIIIFVTSKKGGWQEEGEGWSNNDRNTKCTELRLICSMQITQLLKKATKC